VSPAHLKQFDDFFEAATSPRTSSWWLGPDGEWTRHNVGDDGRALIDLQDRTMTSVQRRRRARAVR
jgi:polyphosphate kinase